MRLASRLFPIRSATAAKLVYTRLDGAGLGLETWARFALTVPKALGLLIIGAFAVVAGCSGADPNDTYENSGGLCIRSTPTGSVRVKVVFPACLSSSCSRTIGAVCSVTESDGEILVTSYAEVERRGSGPCTADCGSLVAECESQVLDPGQYTLAYGAASVAISVPAPPIELFANQAPIPPCF